MRRHPRRGGSALARSGLLAAVLTFLLAAACATPVVDIGSPDLARAKDGNWRGYYDGGMVKVEVEVSTRSHRIESVTIVKHECGLGKPAEKITGSIVSAQSLDVDVVSGASFSSKCILKAVEIALESATA
jgi:uncharacterized protein with FMN-binding domain